MQGRYVHTLVLSLCKSFIWSIVSLDVVQQKSRKILYLSVILPIIRHWACTLNSGLGITGRNCHLLASRGAESKWKRETRKQLREGVKLPFPLCPVVRNVHPSRLLPQPKCLCRPTGQGIRYLWLNQHRYQMGLTFSEEVRRSSSSKVSCIHPHPHHCLALCTYSQPLTSKLSCLNL